MWYKIKLYSDQKCRSLIFIFFALTKYQLWSQNSKRCEISNTNRFITRFIVNRLQLHTILPRWKIHLKNRIKIASLSDTSLTTLFRITPKWMLRKSIISATYTSFQKCTKFIEVIHSKQTETQKLIFSFRNFEVPLVYDLCLDIFLLVHVVVHTLFNA